MPALVPSGILSRLDAVLVVEATMCQTRTRQRELDGKLLIPGTRDRLVREPVSMTPTYYRQSLKTHLLR